MGFQAVVKPRLLLLENFCIEGFGFRVLKALFLLAGTESVSSLGL